MTAMALSRRQSSELRPRRTAARRWLRWVFMIVGVLTVLLVSAAGVAALWAFTILPRSLPSVTALETIQPLQGTKLYDDNDEPISELHVERRFFVPLAQIPQSLRDAVIATEDRRFYSHWGVDPIGIARAVLQNYRRGRIVEGGSTITQQLAKVLFLTPDKSLGRKLREAVLALELERRRTTGQYFLDYVQQALEAKYGADLLFKGGLNVYTTLNPAMQLSAEQALRDGLKAVESRSAKTRPGEHPEGAVVTLEPQTGYVKAMVGGYDFLRSEFNRAVQAKRQPGSAFKPFIYIAALEAGFTPATRIEDSPVSYDAGANGKPWEPENYDRVFRGPTTLQDRKSV